MPHLNAVNAEIEVPEWSDCFWLRLCKNADTVLKSALLRKICQRLVGQPAQNLRRLAFLVAILTVKLALKRFHTA